MSNPYQGVGIPAGPVISSHERIYSYNDLDIRQWRVIARVLHQGDTLERIWDWFLPSDDRNLFRDAVRNKQAISVQRRDEYETVLLAKRVRQ